MTSATVGDRTAGLRTCSGWWVTLPWRLGAVHGFTGTLAARRNSGSGRESAADAGLVSCSGVEQLPVIHTPWVALSVVSSVDPT